MAIGDVVYRHVIVIKESNSPFGFEHTFPCPVCKNELAIMNSNDMTMAPCWNCQGKGYLLIKMNKKNNTPAQISDMVLCMRSATANKQMPTLEKKSSRRKNLRRKIR